MGPGPTLLLLSPLVSSSCHTLLASLHKAAKELNILKSTSDCVTCWLKSFYSLQATTGWTLSTQLLAKVSIPNHLFPCPTPAAPSGPQQPQHACAAPVPLAMPKKVLSPPILSPPSPLSLYDFRTRPGVLPSEGPLLLPQSPDPGDPMEHSSHLLLALATL